MAKAELEIFSKTNKCLHLQFVAAKIGNIEIKWRC